MCFSVNICFFFVLFLLRLCEPISLWHRKQADIENMNDPNRLKFTLLHCENHVNDSLIYSVSMNHFESG